MFRFSDFPFWNLGSVQTQSPVTRHRKDPFVIKTNFKLNTKTKTETKPNPICFIPGCAFGALLCCVRKQFNVFSHYGNASAPKTTNKTVPSNLFFFFFFIRNSGSQGPPRSATDTAVSSKKQKTNKKSMWFYPLFWLWF